MHAPGPAWDAGPPPASAPTRAPPERLRYTDRFDDASLPGEMVVTVTFEAVSVGTALRVEQAGIPEVIPLEACVLGWQESLRHLARLVEPVIPG